MQQQKQLRKSIYKQRQSIINPTQLNDLRNIVQLENRKKSLNLLKKLAPIQATKKLDSLTNIDEQYDYDNQQNDGIGSEKKQKYFLKKRLKTQSLSTQSTPIKLRVKHITPYQTSSNFTSQLFKTQTTKFNDINSTQPSEIFQTQPKLYQNRSSQISQHSNQNTSSFYNDKNQNTNTNNSPTNQKSPSRNSNDQFKNRNQSKQNRQSHRQSHRHHHTHHSHNHVKSPPNVSPNNSSFNKHAYVERPDSRVRLIKNLFKHDTNNKQVKDELKRRYEDDYDFYKHCKDAQKIQEISKFFNNDTISPFQNIIQTSFQQKMLPKKLALFKNRGEPISEVQAQHYSIGEKHSKVFSVGIQQFQKSIDKINVSNNNLTDKSLQNIILSLGTRIRTLNLSNNQMSKQSCQLLGQITQNQTYNLRDINLQGNKLADIVIQPFLQYCVEHVNTNIIVKLNLSKNLITDKSCKILKDFLIKSRELLELYLSWNRLNHEASLSLTQGLQENTLLKVLDLSYNKLGGNENSIKEWVKVLERDDKMDLVHLDLSYNSFTAKESIILAEGLLNNHTIYGFHFKGNIGSIDCKGFLKQDNKNNSQTQSDKYVNNPQINGIDIFQNTQLYDNCWICYGWVELTFWWKPYISDNIDPENILIHFSFDNFEPHPMEKKQNNFQYIKMCPPNQKFYYFYSIGGHPYYSKEKNIYYEKVLNYKITIPYSDIYVDAEVPIMNFMTHQKPQKIFNILYKTSCQVKPRKLEIVNYLLPKEIIIVPWSHNNSMFKDYPQEEEDLLDKCFEKDWNDSKIDRIIPQAEQEQVKILLRQKYKLLKNMYKYYASISPSGELWSIGQNVYTEIMINSKIQNQNYGSSSVSFNFVNTNAGSYKKNASLDTINNNPPNCLIRYQLIEILVRNIYDKYVKGNGQINNFQDAWNIALKEGLEDIFNQIQDEETWREQYYWTQKTEICILKFKNLLERLYFNYAGIKKKQITKNKFMSIDDFRTFVFESQILGDSLADRDINMGYNLAMILQVDEISSSRHIQMYKLEFYEALARFADIICPFPYGTTPDEEKYWPLDKRSNLNVYIKLESLLAGLHLKQDKYFQEDNKIHEYSIFSQEIEDVKQGVIQTVNIRKNVQNKVKAYLKRKSKLGAMLTQKQGFGKLVGIFGASIVKDDKQSVQNSNNVTQTQINKDQPQNDEISDSIIQDSSQVDDLSQSSDNDSIDMDEDEQKDDVQIL